MAEAEEGDKKGEVRFTPSQPLWEYLGWLARNTILGRNENEVAKQILTSRLSEMKKENYESKGS